MKYDIVIIDDDEKIIKNIRFLIEDEFKALNCLYFLKPKEALAEFRDNNIQCNLLLTDNKMPVLNGTELIKELIKIDANIFDKVIIMSDYETEYQALAEILKDRVSILNKPFSFDEVIEHLRTLKPLMF